MKTLSDHILDIVQNSIQAKANLIKIRLEENKIKDICSLIISDNGCGMDTETLKQASNPFFTTRITRKVGLGLSLLKQNAERANGSFLLSSEQNKGTRVEAVFQLSNMDKPVLGEIWDVFYLTLLGNRNVDFELEYETEKGKFELRSTEILEMIDGVPLQQKEIREAIVELIKNNMQEIQ